MMFDHEESQRERRRGENYLDWQIRVAEMDANKRDRSGPLVTPEAEAHGDYRDVFVMHVETHTLARTRRNRMVSPVETLFERGGITKDQLEAAQQIEMAHDIVASGVGLRSASLEARVDNSGAGRDMLIERLGMVRIERAYSMWRDRLPTPRRLVIDMIVLPQPLTATARSYGTRWPIARKRLVDALDRWVSVRDKVCKEIDATDVENLQKRIGGGIVV